LIAELTGLGVRTIMVTGNAQVTAQVVASGIGISGSVWLTTPLPGDLQADKFAIFAGVLREGGFWLISAGWQVLYTAQRNRTLATTGAYAYVRHPQYVGFVLVMFGFLLQWPTLLTVAMFPVLVFMYVRLGRTEEREALAEFGSNYEHYMHEVPAFISRLGDLPGCPKHGQAGPR